MVTFKSQSHGDIPMFGTVAKSMLKMMGQSGNVPGAIMAADVAAARDALQAELKHVEPDTASEKSTNSSVDDDDGDAPVSLSTRALPLLELLQSAIDNGDNVMWE